MDVILLSGHAPGEEKLVFGEDPAPRYSLIFLFLSFMSTTDVSRLLCAAGPEVLLSFTC